MKNTKGITLIALVVTIVVLLILAGVSLNLVIGNNGIIIKGKEAKEEMAQAQVEEAVMFAITSLTIENNGSTSGITPMDIAEQVKKENSQYKNVYAKNESNFPTQIIFADENRKVYVNINNSNSMYEVDIAEEDIAPIDLFIYEVISEEETGVTNGYDSLTTKTARITGLNPKYCNGVDDGYQSENGEVYPDTNYEIILEDGSKITDTLVIPYQVEIEGEMYRITETNISAPGQISGSVSGHDFPKVKTIIFPNTVTKIFSDAKSWNTITTKIILSNNLVELEDRALLGLIEVKNIEIPNSVKNIGKFVFYDWKNDQTITFLGTMEEWNKINIDSSNNYYLGQVTIICSDGTI